MTNIVQLNNYKNHENLAEQMAWDLGQSSKILLGMAVKGSVDSVLAVKPDIAEAFKALAQLMHAIQRKEKKAAERKKYSGRMWKIVRQNWQDGYGA